MTDKVTPLDAVNHIHEFQENNISLYLHCGLCMKEKPAGLSPAEWSDTQAGWTKEGIQIWCNRHEVNILHIDFQGEKHPASVCRNRMKGE